MTTYLFIVAAYLRNSYWWHLVVKKQIIVFYLVAANSPLEVFCKSLLCSVIS